MTRTSFKEIPMKDYQFYILVAIALFLVLIAFGFVAYS